MPKYDLCVFIFIIFMHFIILFNHQNFINTVSVLSFSYDKPKHRHSAQHYPPQYEQSPR